MKEETGKKHECTKPGLKGSHTTSSPWKNSCTCAPGFMCKNVLGSIAHNKLKLEITLSIKNGMEKCIVVYIYIYTMEYNTAIKMSDVSHVSDVNQLQPSV